MQNLHSISILTSLPTSACPQSATIEAVAFGYDVRGNERNQKVPPIPEC
jgi:hypothetical protein